MPWLFKECALSVGPVTGAGGKEAALFTAEVFHMYQSYSAYRQWEFEVLTVDTSDGGGYRVSLLQCKELKNKKTQKKPLILNFSMPVLLLVARGCLGE